VTQRDQGIGFSQPRAAIPTCVTDLHTADPEKMQFTLEQGKLFSVPVVTNLRAMCNIFTDRLQIRRFAIVKHFPSFYN